MASPPRNPSHDPGSFAPPASDRDPGRHGRGRPSPPWRAPRGPRHGAQRGPAAGPAALARLRDGLRSGVDDRRGRRPAAALGDARSAPHRPPSGGRGTVSRIAGRRTPPPIVRDSATVVAGFALAAIVSSLQLLLGLLVLGAVGIVLGMRRNPRWGGIVIGSILGGVVLDAAAVLVQAGSTQPASERFVSALGSALLVGTVLGGALVLPG